MTRAPNWFVRRTARSSKQEDLDAGVQSAVLDATGCSILLLDVDTGNVVGMNKPTESMTGFPREELLDRPLWETILRPEDRPAMAATYAASIKGNVPLSYECPVITKGGDARRVVWSGEFLRDDAGVRTHLVLTAIDVTATQSTAGLFGHLMRAATTTAFVGTDLGGRVTVFSSGAERLTGYSALDVLGKRFPVEAFEPEQLRSRAQAMGVPADLRVLTADARLERRLSGDNQVGTHERRRLPGDIPGQFRPDGAMPRARDWVLVRTDGTKVTVSLSVDPVMDTSGRLVGYLAVGHDVSDQRSTENLLFATLEMEREAVERLHRLDQAKSDFVATVSHELRTPMTSIAGYTELLQESAAGELTADQLEFVDAIQRNSERLTALANDLLILSSLETGNFTHDREDVDLCEVLSSAHFALQSVISARELDVTFETPAHPVVISGDARNLERMVTNLVSNAVKFTSDGGWVRCRLREVDGVAQLEISDNGLGIPEDEQGELFTRFFRSSTALKHAIQGTGLGLTIVASIAHSHDGDVTVVSAHMGGTTFTVKLPMKTSSVNVVRSRPGSAAKSPAARSVAARERGVEGRRRRRKGQ